MGTECSQRIGRSGSGEGGHFSTHPCRPVGQIRRSFVVPAKAGIHTAESILGPYMRISIALRSRASMWNIGEHYLHRLQKRLPLCCQINAVLSLSRDSAVW